MKPRVSNQKTAAMTLVEVLVVIVVLFVLAALILPFFARARTSRGVNCVNNLKQIGMSFQEWAGDNNRKYPFKTFVTNGGTMELNNGRNAWLNFLVMSNELPTPKVLICPKDKKHLPPASDFSSQLAGHISYFVGLDANTNSPQTFLSGDDNFAIGGVLVKSGLLELSTNTTVAWTADRHGFVGNILFGDGSVQMFYDSSFTNWLHQTSVATNRLAIP
jgi:prepilin-type processing-associated H-X9-DG protein